jgi:5-methyltetrahydropteroyltriglutamate--homocysteine methyltransferase
VLKTTTIGSFPKPDYIKKARARYGRGEISRDELKELERKATEEVIRTQEELGLDILVDGEIYRGDMTTYFAELMEGLEISGLVRSYGNRYYRKPVVVNPVRRKGPMTVDWFLYAQGLTSRPIKGMLTGPYTMTDWSFNEYYPTRRDLVLDFAHQLHDEVQDLEKAGAQYIQIDEPAVSTRPEEIDLAIEGLGIVTEGVRAKTITHICYGDFEKVYPKILDLPVDQIALEMSNSGYDLLRLIKKHPFTKELGLGVLDVHSHLIEKKEKVKKDIQETLAVIPPERVVVNPDCGLKTRTQEEAYKKLKVMMEAVGEIRGKLN